MKKDYPNDEQIERHLQKIKDLTSKLAAIDKTVTVSTKKMPDGKWVCYATINGYDYSFEGTGINYVQKQMANLISELFPECRPKVISNDPVIFPKKELKKKENYIGYAKSRIDNNPIA